MSKKNKKFKYPDPFGQALWDYYKNKRVSTSHVIERDDGVAKFTLNFRIGARVVETERLESM